MTDAKGFTLIELMIVVVIIGLLAAIAIPNYANLRDHAKEAGTCTNAHTLQLAVEDYAVSNDGIYSTDAGSLTPLLPGAGMMINPFTSAASEPQYGAAAGAPGQVGIEPIVAGGILTGYRITAFGRDAVILTLSNGQ
ncbi:MAG: type II secretion system protein [Candidatus Krumholzibacteriia bacterium]